MEQLQIEVLRINKELPLPTYQTTGSAGMDLYANIEDEVIIPCSGGRHLIPTGIKAQIPQGYEMQIRPRSGLALKYGVSVLNAPGTIDSDFRGEIGVILINHGNTAFVVRNGDRIAQATFNKVHQAELIEINEIDETTRGENGFGSTGK